MLEPFRDEPVGQALHLRFAAALHRLVLDGVAPELAQHYATVSGRKPPAEVWPATRRALTAQPSLVSGLAALACQTNEIGRCAPLLTGLLHVSALIGSPLRLLEIGASAGLNLNVDRYRYGDVFGPADSLCRLPDPGFTSTAFLELVERRGCDPRPLDACTEQGRLRLLSSVWGDQPERFTRLKSAFTVAAAHPPEVEAAGGAEWLARQLAGAADTPTVVWHSVVKTYVAAGEWQCIEELCNEHGIWRLGYEPEPSALDSSTWLRPHGPGQGPEGTVLARGGGHGHPLTLGC